jgi:DNA-binding MarR family transcriptional regulator
MARLGTGARRRQRSASYLLAGRLRVSMIHLSRQLRHRDPSALTIAKLSALATVVQSGPLSVGQLAEIEGLPSPAATRLADRLEEAGLVERRANPEDRRGIHLVATIRGIQLLERRAETGTAWLADRLAALSDSDHRALERAVTVLEALAAERPSGASEATPELHGAGAGRRRALKEVSR